MGHPPSTYPAPDEFGASGLDSFPFWSRCNSSFHLLLITTLAAVLAPSGPLLSQVVLTPRAPNQVEIKIVWVSGHYSIFIVHRPYLCWQDTPGYPQLLERIQQLWIQGIYDQEIAQTLTGEGFVGLDHEPLSRFIIRTLRLKQGWSVRPASEKTPPFLDGRYTWRGLALACNTDDGWIRTCILNGVIDPTLVTRHPHQRCYLIDASPALIAHLRHLAAQRKQYKKRTASPTIYLLWQDL